MTAALQARGIHRRYGRRTVLRGIDLALEPGQLVALLGPNGAGKTTLMKVLVGLLDPDRGTVDGVAGPDIGWVPQGGATYARLTVRENLALFARLLRMPGSIDATVEAVLADGELLPWADTLASELSGGLRQRLNVAVGLLGQPQVLVLDEPTTGVDLVHRAAMFRVLHERAADGCAVLYSAHALEDAAAADRVVVVVDGVVSYDGVLDALVEPGDVDVTAGLVRLWDRHDEEPG